ncbi:MAG: SAM-dependent methyltransferase [Pseudomonadota bacterium]
MSQGPAQSTQLPSSFRDPAGFVFKHNNAVHRLITAAGLADFDALHGSGLYDALVTRGMLVAHEEVHAPLIEPGLERQASKVILPEQVPYVSYPYEWSFSQLKAAALLTLEVQKLALDHDMSLKDASAYNIQFVGVRPIFIDTLSFLPLQADQPWVAYKQFCEHFLGPLALMSCVDIGLNKLAVSYLDGVPLQMVVSMLPRRTWFNYAYLTHLHLHARSQSRHANAAATSGQVKQARMSKRMLYALNESLLNAVRRCVAKDLHTEWSHYYEDTNYSLQAMDAKARQIDLWLGQHVAPGSVVHDVGANTGYFSAIAAQHAELVVAHDIDMFAVDKHFNALSKEGGENNASQQNILPVHLDFCNPSPALGWGGMERESLFDRCGTGTVMALALVHHLAIGNNTPLAAISEQFARLGDKLIIEFVPKGDSQVDRLLASRPDIFPEYTQAGFERAFAQHFQQLDAAAVEGSSRRLYLFKRISG